MTDKAWYSPDGSPILGTLERLSGRAEIMDIDPDGTPVYEGTTEIFYDDQTTVLHNGEMVFLDENGEGWTFSELLHLTPEEAEAL